MAKSFRLDVFLKEILWRSAAEGGPTVTRAASPHQSHRAVHRKPAGHPTGHPTGRPSRRTNPTSPTITLMVAKHYAQIFRAPGSVGFSSAAFVGRLPMSMLGLGTILMIKESTGKYALAGVVAGTLALVQAFFGPFLARLVDRRGQAEVVFPMLAASVAALVALMLCVRFDEPTWSWFAAAALAGAFLPNVGALVRARWTKIYTGTPQLHTSYSFEAVMDEVVFMIGPILVTFLTLQVHPEAGVGLATGF